MMAHPAQVKVTIDVSVHDYCVEMCWGMYEVAVGDTQVNSEEVVPLIYEKLAEMFPKADIQAYWSDEGSYEREMVFSA